MIKEFYRKSGDDPLYLKNEEKCI